MIALTQRLPNGKSQKVYLHSDNIERIIPWNNGSVVVGVSGGETDTVEIPDEIVKKIQQEKP